MKLKLTKPLVFFDLEATGLDVSADRIVEVSVLKILVNENTESKTYRVNPTIPISPSAFRVHGIKDEDVKDKPTFAEIAPQLAQFMKGCDLAGYNSNKFDIPLLAEEFIRAKIDLDLKKCKYIDVQVIFFKMEQRTLSAAYQFYCGKDLRNAHSAEADTNATFEILESQLDRYHELKNDVNFLSNYTSQTKYVDFAGRIILNEDGKEVFNFGKYKGKVVEEIFEQDKGYYAWMINNDFPLYTKKVLTEIKLRKAFKH